MADENAKNAAVEAVKEETVNVPADKSKPVIMSLIILSVLVMLLTPLVTFFVVRTMMPQAQETAPDDLTNTQGGEVTLEPFRTNIAGTQGSRYAEITVVLEIRDISMAEYFQKRSKEAPNGMLNNIRAKITSVISSKTLSGLLSQDAQVSLQNEIKTTLNTLFEKEKGKKIKDMEVVKEVYFPSFMVQ